MFKINKKRFFRIVSPFFLERISLQTKSHMSSKSRPLYELHELLKMKLALK